jgi:hypothetical protein
MSIMHLIVPSWYDPARDLMNKSGIAASTSAIKAVSSTDKTGAKRMFSDIADDAGEITSGATPGGPGCRVGSRMSLKIHVNG